VRVGLVPARHLPGYLAQGWRIDLRAGTVRNLHTFHPEARAAREELAARGVDLADPRQLAAA
jgi:hypothetical protein